MLPVADHYPGHPVYEDHETSPVLILSDPCCCVVQIRYYGTCFSRFDSVHLPREISRQRRDRCRSNHHPPEDPAPSQAEGLKLK